MKGNNVFEICIITESLVEIVRKIKSAMSKIIRDELYERLVERLLFNSLELIFNNAYKKRIF